MEYKRDFWQLSTLKIHFIVSLPSLIANLCLEEPPDPGHTFFASGKIQIREQVDGATLESLHFKMFFMKVLNLEHNYVEKKKTHCEII